MTVHITGPVPGALGRIIELHGTYYAEHWNMGLPFETQIASGLAAFFARFDPAHDGAWFAQVECQVVGAIFIDGFEAAEKGARLRWFILHPDHHGHGIGHQLMQAAMDFCRAKAFKRVTLGTFAGLAAACHLYEKFGFTIYNEHPSPHLTGDITMREYEWFPA